MIDDKEEFEIMEALKVLSAKSNETCSIHKTFSSVGSVGYYAFFGSEIFGKLSTAKDALDAISKAIEDRNQTRANRIAYLEAELEALKK